MSKEMDKKLETAISNKTAEMLLESIDEGELKLVLIESARKVLNDVLESNYKLEHAVEEVAEDVIKKIASDLLENDKTIRNKVIANIKKAIIENKINFDYRGF